MLDQETRTPEMQEPASAGPRREAKRGLIILAGGLVVALLGTVLWAFTERNQAEDSSADATTANAKVTELERDIAAAESQIADLTARLAGSTNVVVVGGGPLTERQEEMVALVAGPLNEAWRAADGEAVAGFFVPDGVLYDFEGGEVLTVADGTVQAFGSRWAGIEFLPEMLVHGDGLIAVVELGGREVGAVTDFTESGELLIESQAMYDSALGPRR